MTKARRVLLQAVPARPVHPDRGLGMVNGFELGAVFLAILVATHVTNDAESTWYEGLQLLAVYAVLGVVFFA